MSTWPSTIIRTLSTRTFNLFYSYLFDLIWLLFVTLWLLDMHHYGIGEIVLFSSEIELSDLWLPSLGAANITKVNGTPLDRTQTFHALTANYTPIKIRGSIDVAEDKVETNIGECMFISDTAEMCLTATKASVKAPLKPTSTVKQAAGKEGPLELELCHMPSHRARSIKVTTTRKETFCGTVPIEFW